MAGMSTDGRMEGLPSGQDRRRFTGRTQRAVDQNWLSGILGFSSCRDKSKQNNMLTW